MKEQYTFHTFYGATRERLDVAQSIIARYDTRITLRQMFYQFVALGDPRYPNSEDFRLSLGETVQHGRRAGLIDWDAIVDHLRTPVIPIEYDGLRELGRAALESYWLPRWAGQPYHVEIWAEKDAIAGVLAPIAQRAHVTLMINRGFFSDSAMRESAKRIIAREEAGQRAFVFYVGVTTTRAGSTCSRTSRSASSSSAVGLPDHLSRMRWSSVALGLADAGWSLPGRAVLLRRVHLCRSMRVRQDIAHRTETPRRRSRMIMTDRQKVEMM
jgi:hypothetical protein